ncbi:MAG: [Clostridium sp.]|nr:[FeFe] hydrogenase H-cluster maturation GTPase HydF [Clostridium sp.]
MSNLNQTPSANRLHIAFFGCRNAGKSSVVNAVTGQDLAVVSDTKGTTTDPVSKAMELLPLGPVVIIDTPGFDDVGELGELRVRKTRQILNKTDIAVLVVDGTVGLNEWDRQLQSLFAEKRIPYLTVYNKNDLPGFRMPEEEHTLAVSAVTGHQIYELKERIGKLAPAEDDSLRLVGDLIAPKDVVVLVTPIDESAPKGRMILPQQQTMRDVLDAGAMPILTRELELQAALDALSGPPAMVITDSQVFKMVAEITPEEVPLTSFSILMARYKGFLSTAVAGAAALDRLQDGDTILVAEGCTHHRQCNDIGTVKLPRWLRQHTGKQLNFEACSGTEYPEDLSRYAAVIHCCACMVTEREVQYRMRCAVDQGIPFTNYGITIAHVTGILERSVRIFPDIHKFLVP